VKKPNQPKKKKTHATKNKHRKTTNFWEHESTSEYVLSIFFSHILSNREKISYRFSKLHYFALFSLWLDSFFWHVLVEGDSNLKSRTMTSISFLLFKVWVWSFQSLNCLGITELRTRSQPEPHLNTQFWGGPAKDSHNSESHN